MSESLIHDDAPNALPSASRLKRFATGSVRVMLPLVVIVAGGLGAMRLVRTAPHAQQRPPTRAASLVDIRSAIGGAERVDVDAMGTVVAAQIVALQPQVAGEIIEINPLFVPGGHVQEGDVLLRIDPRDYELAVEEARSRVAEADYGLKMELGHQDIARREWELLGIAGDASELDQELALRKPHLAMAKATLAAAEAALEKAQLDLARTSVLAPFNCVITSKNVDVGALVTTQTQLGAVVGTDEYWVEVSLPVDRLQWIEVPAGRDASGSPVKVVQHVGSQATAEWSGQVIRLLGDLEPQGRMARLLVAVPDPLHLRDGVTDGAPLLIGSYVDVTIAGQELPDVFAVAREELREHDTVWLMTETGALEIRNVNVAFRGRERVLVSSGLEEGEHLVTSDLPAPVAGMPLRIASSEPASPEEVPLQAAAVGSAQGDGQ